MYGVCGGFNCRDLLPLSTPLATRRAEGRQKVWASGKKCEWVSNCLPVASKGVRAGAVWSLLTPVLMARGRIRSGDCAVNLLSEDCPASGGFEVVRIRQRCR